MGKSARSESGRRSRQGVIAKVPGILAGLCAVLLIAVGLLVALPPTGPSPDTVSNTAQGQAAPVEGAEAPAAGVPGDAGADATESESAITLDDQLPDHEPGAVLASLAEGFDAQSAELALASEPGLSGTSLQSGPRSTVELSLPASLSVSEALDKLSQMEAFDSAQPNFYYQCADDEALAAESSSVAAGSAIPGFLDQDETLRAQSLPADYPDDPYYKHQWGLVSIKAKQAWEYLRDNGRDTAAASNPVIVAVADSGFDVTHPDLAPNIVDPYNTRDGSGNVSGDADHGTHVAGIVGAAVNNGVGVAGVADNLCKVMPIKIVGDDGKMSTKMLLKAFEHVEEQVKAGKNIRVINMSVGLSYRTPTVGSRSVDTYLYEGVQDLQKAGVVAVAAACNQDDIVAPFYAYPSDYDNVISVIGLSEGLDVTEGDLKSNYNTADQLAKNISAPGASILSTFDGVFSNYKYALDPFYKTRYGMKSGTSMASAMVAGVLGLEFAAQPSLTAQEAMSKLYSSARDINESGWDRKSGYGEADAAAAVSADTPYLSGDIRGYGNGSAHVYTVKINGVAQPSSQWTWESSNPSVASFEGGAGRLVMRNSGEALITARKGDQKACLTVSVYGIEGASQLAPNAGANYEIHPLCVNSWSWTLSDGSKANFTTTSNDGRTFIRVNNTKGNSTGQAWTVDLIATNKYDGTQLRKTITLESSPVQQTQAEQKSQPMYRMYNPNTGEHFYTASAYERDSLKKAGWRFERIGWYAPLEGDPVYRLYNKNVGDHHYTLSAYERDSLKRAGWRDEGIGWYSDPGKKVKLYREYNKNQFAWNHNYTTSKYEHDSLIRIGWRDEGTAWYGV